MRITESRLRSIIRNIILSESKKKLNLPIDKRISKQIEILYINQAYISLEDLGNKLIVSVKKKHDEKELGRVKFSSLDVVNEKSGCPRDKSKKSPVGVKVGGGKKKKIWQVVHSYIQGAEDGYGLRIGPILYEIGIEYISKFKDCAVMSHSNVSEYAFKVWEKFDKRPDFEKYQLDIDTKSSDMTMKKPGRIFNVDGEVDQLTPEDDSDDLWFSLYLLSKYSNNTNYDNIRNNWSLSPLTRAFFNDKGRVIKFLHSKSMIFKV